MQRLKYVRESAISSKKLNGITVECGLQCTRYKVFPHTCFACLHQIQGRLTAEMIDTTKGTTRQPAERVRAGEGHCEQTGQATWPLQRTHSEENQQQDEGNDDVPYPVEH